MSPEQVQAKELDTRTDLFSFGAVRYEMATGGLRGDTSGVVFKAILDGTLNTSGAVESGSSSGIGTHRTKYLEKDRNLRYQTRV